MTLSKPESIASPVFEEFDICRGRPSGRRVSRDVGPSAGRRLRAEIGGLFEIVDNHAFAVWFKDLVQKLDVEGVDLVFVLGGF
jgi:hypothetical protein